MKNSISIIIAITFSIGFINLSCNTPAEKVEKAETRVMEANSNLDSAIKDYQKDINSYKIETAEKIIANQKSINEFNARIAKEKKEARDEYIRKITVLERKNTDLKKRLEDYNADGAEKWRKFKKEFNDEMEDLGKSIKDLTSSRID
jgi:hypothetical protein